MIRIIKRPQLESATILKPMELNKIHFSGKHTRLTPELLRQNARETHPPR